MVAHSLTRIGWIVETIQKVPLRQRGANRLPVTLHGSKADTHQVDYFKHGKALLSGGLNLLEILLIYAEASSDVLALSLGQQLASAGLFQDHFPPGGRRRHIPPGRRRCR